MFSFLTKLTLAFTNADKRDNTLGLLAKAISDVNIDQVSSHLRHLTASHAADPQIVRPVLATLRWAKDMDPVFAATLIKEASSCASEFASKRMFGKKEATSLNEFILQETFPVADALLDEGKIDEAKDILISAGQRTHRQEIQHRATIELFTVAEKQRENFDPEAALDTFRSALPSLHQNTLSLMFRDPVELSEELDRFPRMPDDTAKEILNTNVQLQLHRILNDMYAQMEVADEIYFLMSIVRSAGTPFELDQVLTKEIVSLSRNAEGSELAEVGESLITLYALTPYTFTPEGSPGAALKDQVFAEALRAAEFLSIPEKSEHLASLAIAAPEKSDARRKAYTAWTKSLDAENFFVQTSVHMLETAIALGDIYAHPILQEWKSKTLEYTVSTPNMRQYLTSSLNFTLCAHFTGRTPEIGIAVAETYSKLHDHLLASGNNAEALDLISEAMQLLDKSGNQQDALHMDVAEKWRALVHPLIETNWNNARNHIVKALESCHRNKFFVEQIGWTDTGLARADTTDPARQLFRFLGVACYAETDSPLQKTAISEWDNTAKSLLADVRMEPQNAHIVSVAGWQVHQRAADETSPLPKEFVALAKNYEKTAEEMLKKTNISTPPASPQDFLAQVGGHSPSP
jgi:hypothetical protein